MSEVGNINSKNSRGETWMKNDPPPPPKRESVVSTMTFSHTNVKYAKMFKSDPLLYIAYAKGWHT